MDSDRGNMHVANHAGSVLGQHDARLAVTKAPHVLVAGVPTASMFNDKLQVDLLFLGDLIALHTADVFSE